MSGANIVFLIVGILFTLVGLAMLAVALKSGKHDGSIDRAERRSTALLISGMMVLAFGLVMSGFAIAYATTKPYDFSNTAAA
jgi:Ca2+/H+ antiporter